MVGYPQLAFPQPNPTSSPSPASTTTPICYNSTITVSPTGAILATYDKTHLYYTDETWAQESPSGWLTCSLPLPWRNEKPASSLPSEEKGVNASFGICMDINPHRFTAPWTTYEFATAALRAKTDILLLSMAWLTQPPPSSSSSSMAAEATAPLAEDPNEPDTQTWAYWCTRLQPLIEQRERDIIVVVACRSGAEGERSPGDREPSIADGAQKHSGEEKQSGNGEMRDELVRYAGTSWIGRLGHGKVAVWGVLGKAEESVLVADTRAQAWDAVSN